MTRYQEVRTALQGSPHKWLVTGVAGFIGSNLLAATTYREEASSQVYNVAVGDRTTLNELFESIRSGLEKQFEHLRGYKPEYRDFRPGDVRHSLADISKAKELLGYVPTHRIKDGLGESLDWYIEDLAKAEA